MPSLIKWETGNGDAIVIHVERDVVDFQHLSELVSHLIELESIFIEVMSAHSRYDVKTRIDKARIEGIYSGTPVHFETDVDLSYLSIAYLIFAIRREVSFL